MKEMAAAESNEVVYVLWHLIRLCEIITALHLHAEASGQGHHNHSNQQKKYTSNVRT